MSGSSTVPTPMEDLTGSLVKLGAVVTAGKLNLFHFLSHGPRTVADIAAGLGTSEEGARYLVEQLVAVGYLESDSNTYRNGPIPHAWLEPGSQADLGDFLLWLDVVWPRWGVLDQTVRDGCPRSTVWDEMKELPEHGRIFARYLRAAASFNTELIVDAITLPQGTLRMLDLGGGHGAHSVAFCTKYPQLQADVYDLEFAREVVEQTVTKASEVDRITFKGGDYLTDPIGKEYDVVFCSDIFHNHPDELCRALAAKISTALKPGGLFVYYGLFSDQLPDPVRALVNIVFFMESKARAYSFEETKAWMADAGLGSFSLVQVPQVAGRSLATAVKNVR